MYVLAPYTLPVFISVYKSCISGGRKREIRGFHFFAGSLFNVGCVVMDDIARIDLHGTAAVAL